jgi:Fe-S-cluster-containing dehydrogenase component/formate-dependent nitrite reductase membrane component NrfD
MQVGFVIDQRKCIGCHACTVACKAENDVPLGNFRTWVKYVEKGSFPQVRRHFTVLRCNHCDRAPCVTICPVNALHKRPDAIVDLDRDLCIGCRACMQACPYDALSFNEDRGVAEKCHYCAHRTELGLEPACVVVCPAEAIVAGDVSNPESDIATLIREQPTSRRRLDKGTQPRVWYVDALPEALVPGQPAEPPSYLWSERADVPPPAVAGFEPPADLTTTLDVAHPPAWGWHVWVYLVTKNIAAGAALVAPFLAALGAAPGFGRDYVPELVALAFLGLTLFLLVHDLGQPARFWRLLLKPNPRSWLVKGAWVLGAFGLATMLALGLRVAGRGPAADVVRGINVPLAVLASGYSAWLFAQCRGRDLWLERGLFVQLVLRAGLCGTALALFLPRVGAHAISPAGSPAAAPAVTPERLFGVLVLANLIPWIALRFTQPHAGAAARAQALLRRELRTARPGMTLAAAAALAFAVPFVSHELRAVDLVFRVAMTLQVLAAMLTYERIWIHTGQVPRIS